MKIISIDHGQAGSDLEGEYVQIKNQGPETISLDNWSLRDEAGHIDGFPALIQGRLKK